MNFFVTNCKYCFFAILLVMTACAYRPKIVLQCVPPLRQCAIVKEPSSLPVTEKLIYVLSWHGIPSGRLTLETKGVENIDGRNYYHVIATAGPNNFFSIFFNIKYTVETYVDKDTGLPLKFYKKKSSRGKVAEETIVFDYSNDTAIWEYTGKTKKEIEFAKNSQDLLSFLYYFRLKGLEANKVYNFNILYNGKSWPIKMVTGNVNLIKLGSGDCINTVSVELSSSLISKLVGGEILNAYVSADSKRIPVFFTIKSKGGQADAVLSNFKCLK
ncbi:MAG: DUF3108 domain-containing protein [Candidatus Omnitrophota bacterium]